MASRTQIVCLHEGEEGRSIDPVFIRVLLKALSPTWIRPWKGSNVVRTLAKGGRSQLIAAMPRELQICLSQGGNTTLMVWADVDDDMADCNALKESFWIEAKRQELSRKQFDEVVFVFAKDRLENWIEFLRSEKTDESKEAPRLKNGSREAAEAARILAKHCRDGVAIPGFPLSLEWSCSNWRKLIERMR